MIVPKKHCRKFLGQEGQAIFEMILFLPILMFLYTIYYTAGNSISGSINQQKAVRGYFYGRIKGNSYLLSLPDLKAFSAKGVKLVGFSSIGWRDKFVGENAIAPCFRFSSLLKNGSTEVCDSDERDEDGESRFIRLFTYYGVCGPTYYETNDELGAPYYNINPGGQTQIGSCTLSK